MDSGHQPDGRAATPSAAAREQEDRIRDTVGTLTDLVPTPRVRRYRLRVLIGLLMMVLAGTLGMLLLLRQAALDDEQRVSAPAAAPAAPAAEAPAAPAADAPAADAAAAAAPAASGACSVDPEDVTVSTVVTTTTPDNHGTTIRGETTITNAGDVPVYIAWHESQSTGHDNSGRELTSAGWYGGPFLLGPRESRTELVGVRVFDRGDRTWTLITDLAAFADSPDCFDEVMSDGDAGLVRLARPVPNPFPAGP